MLQIKTDENNCSFILFSWNGQSYVVFKHRATGRIVYGDQKLDSGSWTDVERELKKRVITLKLRSLLKEAFMLLTSKI